MQSVISSFASVGLLIAGFTAGPAPAGLVAFEVNTQFLFHFKSKETSQLIQGMSRTLKNVLKYSNGTAILMFSNSELLSLIFLLNLFDSQQILNL